MALILVVDDEAPIRDLICTMLEDAGHRALSAINGIEGLAAALRERPDLVISDVMMPLMSGAEMCLRIKSELRPPKVPVILVSAANPKATEGSGADAFVHKPFDLDELEALVDKLLGTAVSRPGTMTVEQ